VCIYIYICSFHELCKYFALIYYGELKKEKRKRGK
jgi:hypothetical protein